MAKKFLSKEYFNKVVKAQFDHAFNTFFNGNKDNVIFNKVASETNKNVLLGGDSKKIEEFKELMTKFQNIYNLDKHVNSGVNKLFKTMDTKNNRLLSQDLTVNLLDENEETKYSDYLVMIENQMKEFGVPEVYINYAKNNPTKDMNKFIDKSIKKDMDPILKVREEEKKQNDILMAQEKAKKEKEEHNKRMQISYEEEQKEKEIKENQKFKDFFNKHEEFLTDQDKLILDNSTHKQKLLSNREIVTLQERIYNGLQLPLPPTNIMGNNLIKDEAQEINEIYKTKNPDEYLRIAKENYNRIFINPENEYEKTLDFKTKVESLKMYSELRRLHESRVKPKWYHFFYRGKFNREKEYLRELEEKLQVKGITKDELDQSLTKDANFVVAETEIKKAGHPEYYKVEHLANDRLLIADDLKSVENNVNKDLNYSKEDLRKQREWDLEDGVIDLINKNQGVDIRKFNEENKWVHYVPDESNVIITKSEEPLIDSKKEDKEELIETNKEDKELGIPLTEEELIDDDNESVRSDYTIVDKGTDKEDKDYVYHKESTRIYTFGIDSKINDKKIEIDEDTMSNDEIEIANIYNKLDFKGKSIDTIKADIKQYVHEACYDFEVFTDIDALDDINNEWDRVHNPDTLDKIMNEGHAKIEKAKNEDVYEAEFNFDKDLSNDLKDELNKDEDEFELEQKL